MVVSLADLPRLAFLQPYVKVLLEGLEASNNLLVASRAAGHAAQVGISGTTGFIHRHWQHCWQRPHLCAVANLRVLQSLQVNTCVLPSCMVWGICNELMLI
jgi:hypothetical protein